MLEIFIAVNAAILTLAVAGLIKTIVTPEPITIKTLKKKIEKNISKPSVSKVAVISLSKLLSYNDAADVTNNSLFNSKAKYCIANIDCNGNIIGEIELISDNEENMDPDIVKLLGEEEMVVIES